MKNLTALLTFFLLLTVNSIAQKKEFTLNDVVNGGTNYYNLRPKSLSRLTWADNESFTYVKNDSALVIQNIAGKEEVILTIEEFKALAFDYKGNYFPYYKWQNNNVIEFYLPQVRLFYNIKEKKSWHITLPQKAANIDVSFTAKKIAYTIDNNLYYATPDETKTALTTAQDTGIVCGQTVHRNEFGIMKGTFWSPNGSQLAFYRKDESMVGDYPLVDILARQAKENSIKYPMAGMKSHHVTIGIFNFDSNSTTYLKTSTPEDRYFTNISWSPENDILYIAEVNRGQDTIHLNSYDAKSGEFIKTLFTETDEQYIEPEHTMLFLPRNPDEFIWQSRKDGYNHLYLYNTEGELQEQLTKGEWEVTDVLGFDSKGKKLIFSSTEKSYIERHTYVLDLKKKDHWSLTVNDGVHNSKLSPDGSYVLDTWSSVEIPLVTDLINVNNGRLKNLLIASDPYANYKIGKTKLFSIQSADSTTELSCRMILPADFDKTKKYPTIIYVYGGPHSQLISNRWKGGVQMWQHYMAQKGYIMFTVDNRGTSFRGADFEQVIHRELGKHEMEDQMKGYEYLTSLDYVDSERIGVFGWSFGGFMTTSLMTHYPDAFKVGVAGGPVIDWSNYEIMYGERYMDTPVENPQGYKVCNVTNYAKDLKGRLLMIHGGQDPVVVWQHSQKFIRQCVIDGVELDYFVYPTHEHNVRGKDRVHLMQKITRHFDDFL